MPEFDSRHQQRAIFLAADGSSSRNSGIASRKQKGRQEAGLFAKSSDEDQYFATIGPPKV
jgi:hypothetical protein